MTFDIELSKIITAIIAFIVYLIVAMVLYPKILGIPFGKLPPSEFSRKIGLYIPQNAFKHILLGDILSDVHFKWHADWLNFNQEICC